MFDGLIKYYYDYFINDKNDGWLLLKSSVCLILLNELYTTFTSEGITPIEALTEIEKKKYWEAACKMYDSKDVRITAAKAAYVLNLITSKD